MRNVTGLKAVLSVSLAGLILSSLVACPQIHPKNTSIKSLVEKNPYLKHDITEQLKAYDKSYRDFFTLTSESPLAAQDFGLLSKLSRDSEAGSVEWIFSPDGRMAIALNGTTQDPDHSLDIYNRQGDQHVERLAFCGTPCNYIGAYWLDNENFAFVQLIENYPTDSDEQDGYVLTVSDYDLSHATVVNYQSSRLGK